MSKGSPTKEELEKKVLDLEREIKNLESDLIHDPMTKLKTRAFLEEELESFIASLVQNESGKRREWFGFRNLSVIFFDIDKFKNINDTYGHDTGDIVLQRVAKAIQGELRAGDTAARWGGEEMVASLLGAIEKDALEKAESVRKKIENIEFPEAPGLKLTMSSGVASYEPGISAKELVKRADRALYVAKNFGRNKVVAYSEISEKES